jgi:MFS family permease
MPADRIKTTEKDLERNRLLVILEGASARTIFNLTSGAFLVGLLKYMGASDAFCGYVISIPVFAAIIQVLSPMILESLKYRKTMIIIGAMIHRILLSMLIIVPFLPLPSGIKLFIAAIVLFISNLAISFVNPAISNMYVSFVPQNIRGRYFGTRESYILIAATLITLVLGKILDVFNDMGNEGTGYIIVYCFIFLLTIINFSFFALMKEGPLLHTTERIKLSEIFTLPLKNKKFIRYFIMLIIWNFAVQIASAYFGVYLKSDLSMSYTIITSLSFINAVIYILSARIWGRFADRNGWSKTTMITIGILSICHFTWFFASEGSPAVLFILILSHITSGMAWSGINVALFNLQFDFTPDEKRTVYIGFSAAISGLIGYISAIFGAQLVGLFGEKPVMILGASYDIKQVLFLASAILLAFCAAYIGVFMHSFKYK